MKLLSVFRGQPLKWIVVLLMVYVVHYVSNLVWLTLLIIDLM